MASSSSSTKKKSSSSSSYDAFNAVDKLVAKPVMGSDGAAAWQEFRKDTKQPSKKSSAPMAPLKAADRAMGRTSWSEERQHEASIRKESGQAPLNAGYTHFSNDKASAEEAARGKEKRRILERRRPDEEPYFLPSKTFEGWKKDYVFTTKVGSGGTGYYWDGMDSVKQLKGEPIGDDDRKEKPSSSVASHSDKEKRPQPESSTTASEPQSSKKKKRKREKQAVTIVNDPTNPMEQVAAAIEKRLQQQQQALSNRDEHLAPGWEAAVDPVSGKTYYFERSTGKRSWDKPESCTDSSLPEGWSSAKDPSTGKEYYYHAASGETKWERPS